MTRPTKYDNMSDADFLRMLAVESEQRDHEEKRRRIQRRVAEMQAARAGWDQMTDDELAAEQHRWEESRREQTRKDAETRGLSAQEERRRNNREYIAERQARIEAEQRQRKAANRAIKKRSKDEARTVAQRIRDTWR